MGWLTILFRILPFVVSLMEIAEKAFDKEPDSGEDKKDFVMKGAKSVIGAVTAVSTGGQKDTWEALSGPISMVIDAACSFLFPHED